MSVAISWGNKVQLAKCDIMVSFPKSGHILLLYITCIVATTYKNSINIFINTQPDFVDSHIMKTLLLFLACTDSAG